MTLATLMSSAAEAGVFLDADEFGETISYTPYGGVARDIVAIVDRGQAAPLPNAPQAVRPSIVVTVSNSATLGILASSMDTARDIVSVARRIGGSAETMRIARVVWQDDAMLSVEVR